MSDCNKERWPSLSWLMHPSLHPSLIFKEQMEWAFQTYISLCCSELLMPPHQQRMRPQMLTFRPFMTWPPLWPNLLSLSSSFPFLKPHLPHCCLLTIPQLLLPQGLCTCTLLLTGWLFLRYYETPSSFILASVQMVPSQKGLPWPSYLKQQPLLLALTLFYFSSQGINLPLADMVSISLCLSSVFLLRAGIFACLFNYIAYYTITDPP